MATFSIAGVYREESQAPQPRVLGTGVPAFLGYVSRGPDAPYPIFGWSQFREMFGTEANSYLAPAVRGFFENGGNLCYVVRVRRDLAPWDALGVALDGIDIDGAVDLLCFPDAMQDPKSAVAQQQQMVEWCDRSKVCFAILDPLPNVPVDQVVGQWQELSGVSAALYYPWIQVAAMSGNGAITTPPCGHIAGVYASTDRAKGVFQAPANSELEGVYDLSYVLTDEEQAALDPLGVVNCLRVFPGRGIRLWGARTINGQSDWRSINVRRLFLSVHRWLKSSMSSVGYEPNTPVLWARIRRTIVAYLEDLYRRGALVGSTPAQAFYVRCDASTTSASLRDAGRVVAEIGFAPAVPSEFIVVRLVYDQGELLADETDTSLRKET